MQSATTTAEEFMWDEVAASCTKVWRGPCRSRACCPGSVWEKRMGRVREIFHAHSVTRTRAPRGTERVTRLCCGAGSRSRRKQKKRKVTGATWRSCHLTELPPSELICTVDSDKRVKLDYTIKITVIQYANIQFKQLVCMLMDHVHNNIK